MEIWKDIKGYESLYQISNTGKIKSLQRYVCSKNGSKQLIKEKIRKTSITTAGYEYVVLANKGKNKTLLVHRLVAETFLPNPFNLKCVNHKDENKHNNNINNLEWCTRKYNMNYNKLPLKKYKKVLKFNKEGCLLCIYTSLKEAAELSNLSKSTISGYCNNLHKDPNGYIWKYETKK